MRPMHTETSTSCTVQPVENRRTGIADCTACGFRGNTEDHGPAGVARQAVLAERRRASARKAAETRRSRALPQPARPQQTISFLAHWDSLVERSPLPKGP